MLFRLKGGGRTRHLEQERLPKEKRVSFGKVEIHGQHRVKVLKVDAYEQKKLRKSTERQILREMKESGEDLCFFF